MTQVCSPNDDDDDGDNEEGDDDDDDDDGMSDAGLGHQRNNGVIEGEPVSFSVS